VGIIFWCDELSITPVVTYGTYTYMYMCRTDDVISTDTVGYCWDDVSCYGNKIPALSGELLITKTQCCGALVGVSWGENQCESCSPQTADSTDLPVNSAGKYTKVKSKKNTKR